MAANNMVPPMDPRAMAAMGMPNPFAPPEPPPPSPTLGFQVWGSDPRNAMKIQPSMTAPDAPLQPNAGMASANPPQPPPMASAAPPTMPAAQPPAPTQLGADQTELQRLQKNGAGLNQTHNGFLRGLEKAGDIALPFLIGGGAAAVPGTTLHNRYLQREQQGRIENDQAALQADMTQREGAANLAHTQAETAAIPINAGLKQQQAMAALATHGLKVEVGDDGMTHVVPDEDSPVYQQQQQKDATLKSQSDYMQAGVLLRQAQAELARVKNDPNSPAYKQAAQKLATAQQNADAMGLRAKAQWGNYLMHSQGTDMQGNPLAGAMITDNGDTVGSAFSQNVRPTGTERNKGDMAGSAAEQLSTIADIVKKNPQMFGPGYGQTTEFRKWIGSQDPDAQRFLSARTIAADHLSGTFGGHSEYATKAIDDAIGQFKDNPQAALAGIDQLTNANARFQKAGAVKTIGSKSNPMAPPKQGAPKGVQVLTDGGTTYHIPTAQVAAFKKDHPNAR